MSSNKEKYLAQFPEKHALRIVPYSSEEMLEIRRKMFRGETFTTEERARLFAILYEYIGLYENRERVWKQSKKSLADLLEDAAEAIRNAY